MKVRESLTDSTSDGTSLTIPEGISRHPHNTLFVILNFLSIVLIIFGFITLFPSLFKE